jgi:hypothetical protein
VAYSLLGITDPRQWGIGDDPNSIQSIAGRFGASVNRGMTDGMRLGTAVTQYGMNQRLAGAREDTARQALNTARINSQNQQLAGALTQQSVVCEMTGWATPECKAIRMEALRQKTAACQLQGWTGAECASVRAESLSLTGRDPVSAQPGQQGQTGATSYPVAAQTSDAAMQANSLLGIDEQATSLGYPDLGLGGYP